MPQANERCSKWHLKEPSPDKFTGISVKCLIYHDHQIKVGFFVLLVEHLFGQDCYKSHVNIFPCFVKG